jgi:hypothetical protein
MNNWPLMADCDVKDPILLTFFMRFFYTVNSLSHNQAKE